MRQPGCPHYGPDVRASEPTEGGARCGQDGAAGLPGRPGAGFRMVRAAGVQSEMELVFTGLHQLLAPMLDHLRVAALPD